MCEEIKPFKNRFNSKISELLCGALENTDNAHFEKNKNKLKKTIFKTGL
jgi:hypothetical protein